MAYILYLELENSIQTTQDHKLQDKSISNNKDSEDIRKEGSENDKMEASKRRRKRPHTNNYTPPIFNHTNLATKVSLNLVYGFESSK